MKRLAFIAVLLAAVPARADVLALFAQVNIGASGGTGLGGDQKDNDFFQRTKGLTYGALVGAKILFLRLWIEHQQYTNFSEFRGTWTQFMIGGGFDLPLGDVPVVDIVPFELGITFGAGFGLGTGQQISPPLDNAQISDKGVVGEVAAALRYRFNGVVALGVQVPLTVAYLWKNDAPINQAQSYSSVSVKGLVFLELTLGL